ncbi:MAG: c-type cytochrome [Pedobacter sp.]|uniref:c-type cytochrome n=1 Tax=Pedobacter sp. TaxID=1411316 RepID=UPI00356785DF
MKKFQKTLIYIALVLFIVIGSALSYVKFALPNVGDSPDLKIEVTAERIENGKYLANHVTLCIDCHSQRDWTSFSGPPVPGSLGKGGEKFDESIGFPGTVYSPNITPFNLKNWTDGELFRLITTGVTKDGKALINLMPYPAYSKMDKEDIYDIIAYIRTLPEQSSEIPERKLNVPLNFIVNTIPAPATLQTKPLPSDTLKYGGYLVNAAACVDCHTKQDKGSNLKGMEFAGGRDFMMPSGTVYSTNITADKTTGIGNWTAKLFINKFKAHAQSGNTDSTSIDNQFQTVMPWTMYGGLKESDLSAMFAYLKTIKPINHQVTRFVPKK